MNDGVIRRSKRSKGKTLLESDDEAIETKKRPYN